MEAKEKCRVNESDDGNSCFQGFPGNVRIQDAALLGFVLSVLLQDILITQMTPS